MTRINVGIPVEDLCDQHLLAEYRELPRMVLFARSLQMIQKMDFTLNTGHMKSCVRYGAYLAARHQELIEELKLRRFDPKFKAISAEDFPRVARETPSPEYLHRAIAVLYPRIIDRLQTMKRHPTWTQRTRPDWTVK